MTSAGCLVNAFILSSPARLHSVYKQSDGLRNRPSYKVTKLKKVFARQDLTCGGNECCTKGESQSGEMQVGPGQNSPCYHNFIGLVRGDGNVQMHGSVTAVAVWPTLTRPLHTSLFVCAVSLSLSLSLCVCVCVCLRKHISGITLHIFTIFYRAMLCIRGTSHGPVSVCLSQVGVLLKRLNVGSHKQHHTIVQGL